jgi:hypothetical protein
LDELFSTSLPISAIRQIIGEFDTWVRIKVACITDSASNHVEVAEVAYLLDELSAAFNLRIDVEESDRERLKAAAAAAAESAATSSGAEPDAATTDQSASPRPTPDTAASSATANMP